MLGVQLLSNVGGKPLSPHDSCQFLTMYPHVIWTKDMIEVIFREQSDLDC